LLNLGGRLPEAGKAGGGLRSFRQAAARQDGAAGSTPALWQGRLHAADQVCGMPV